MNNLFLSRKTLGFLGFCLLCGTSFSSLQAKTVWLEADDFRTEIAQGDGEEPVTFSLTNDELELRAAAGDIQKETVSDEKIPTLTAEGDFLLPTYVLPETQTDVEFEKVTSVDENNPWRQETVSVPFPEPEANTTTKVVKVETRRVVAAQPTPIAVPTPAPVLAPAPAPASSLDGQLLENIEKQYQETNELLRVTSQKLAALEKGLNEKPAPSFEKGNCSAAENVRKSPLLLPLAPIKDAPSAQKEQGKDDLKVKTPGYEQKEYIDYVLAVIKRVSSQPVSFTASDSAVLRSIPKEMKINFLPETADISNQSMKWIKAFSYNPARTVENVVEVRMSGKDLDLQSRRFALIKGALLSNGLTPRQIRFVLTDRDPDTIVLRNITLPLEEEISYYTDDKKTIPQKIQKW